MFKKQMPPPPPEPEAKANEFVVEAGKGAAYVIGTLVATTVWNMTVGKWIEGKN